MKNQKILKKRDFFYEVRKSISKLDQLQWQVLKIDKKQVYPTKLIAAFETREDAEFFCSFNVD